MGTWKAPPRPDKPALRLTLECTRNTHSLFNHSNSGTACHTNISGEGSLITQRGKKDRVSQHHSLKHHKGERRGVEQLVLYKKGRIVKGKDPRQLVNMSCGKRLWRTIKNNAQLVAILVAIVIGLILGVIIQRYEPSEEALMWLGE